MLIIDKLSTADNLTETEENISKFLLSLGKEMESISTRVIGERTYSSPATVIRLCKKIGFSGFDEFKAQYLKELIYLERQYGAINVNFPFEKYDSMMTVTNKIAALYHETIDDTISLLKHDDMQKVKDLVIEAEIIYLFSYGTALNQAESFKEKMMKIGKKVVISTNLNYQLYEASCMEKGDVAVIISYSGETENALKLADICRKKEVPIVAVTSFGENSLSGEASGILYMSTKENLMYNIADYSIHVSINLLLDMVYSLVFQENFDEYYRHKIEFSEFLEGKRKSSNSLLMNTRDETL